ncbi:MAG: WecB/TagA/CpsF family glycosyltransferase [Gemmatimonadota bacterium]
MTRPRFRIGTLDLDTITFNGALEAIQRLVDQGKGGAVFTPNVDHVMLAERDVRLRDAYSRSSLAVADGVPIVFASRLIGPVIPEKVSGSDLILPLMELAARQRWRVYLLGGADGVAYEAADILRGQYGVNIVGVDDSMIHLVPTPDEEAVVERIAAAQPDLLLVALGCPKQELFIDRLRPVLGKIVAIGVGASLDFVSGRINRAPGWMSRNGLEWCFRLSKEPRRLWKRYLLVDTRFVFVIAKTWMRRA